MWRIAQEELMSAVNPQEAGKELECDWSKAQRRMGSSELIRQARRDCTLQIVDCNIDLKRQIKTCGSPEFERRKN